MTTLWVLLTLTCYGHTNSECWLKEPRTYPTKEACLAADSGRGGSVCLPATEAPGYVPRRLAKSN